MFRHCIIRLQLSLHSYRSLFIRTRNRIRTTVPLLFRFDGSINMRVSALTNFVLLAGEPLKLRFALILGTDDRVNLATATAVPTPGGGNRGKTLQEPGFFQPYPNQRNASPETQETHTAFNPGHLCGADLGSNDDVFKCGTAFEKHIDPEILRRHRNKPVYAVGVKNYEPEKRTPWQRSTGKEVGEKVTYDRVLYVPNDQVTDWSNRKLEPQYVLGSSIHGPTPSTSGSQHHFQQH